MFSLMAELVQFGIVMFVVLIGFAVSFHALLRDLESFGETLLHLFNAMLGEVELIDEFSGTRHDVAETILLVSYLVVFALMLLNLLLAILSTSHAKVQENADREFRVSKARVIQYYRVVVDEHILPAPFNLLQLIVSLPFVVVDRIFWWTRQRHHRLLLRDRCNEAVRRTVFWLLLGPIAVTQGALLCMASALSSTFVWRSHYAEQTELLKLRASAARAGDPPRASVRHMKETVGSLATFMAATHLILVAWCLVGAPLCLLAMWLELPLILSFCVIRPVERVKRALTSRKKKNLSQKAKAPPLLLPSAPSSVNGGGPEGGANNKRTIDDMI